MVEIDKLNLSIKGEVHAWTECDGVITQEIRQPNLWLDMGIKNILADTGTDKYLALSSNDVDPSYTDIVIPSVIIDQVIVPSYNNDLRRHSFIGSFSPPVIEREIKTIGLTLTASGINPYCYTKLSESITQGVTEVLFVYYYIYVIASDVSGFGKTGFDEIASNIFTGNLRTSYLYMAEKVGINEILKDEQAEFYDDRWHDLGARIESTDTAEPDRFLIKKVTGNFGSSSELDTWTSSSWKGMFRDYGGFRQFQGQHVGRVWPKNKNSTATWFSSAEADLPAGYYKAFQVRPTESTFPSPTSFLNFYINDTGGIGSGSYYYTEDLHYYYYFFDRDIGDRDTRVSIFPNKFNRQIIVVSSNDAVDFISYETLGSSADIYDHYYALIPVWDDYYGDKIYFIYRQNGIASINDSVKEFSFSDINNISSDITKTDYLGYSEVYYAQFINTNMTPPFSNSGHEMLLWYKEDNRIGYFDPELSSNRFYTSYIDNTNVVMGRDTSFGMYDESNDTIVLNTLSGLMVYDKTGNNAINQFNGIADFSTEVINWSQTDAYNGGLIEQSDSKLKLALSRFSLETQSGTSDNDYGTRIAQHLKAGEFEVTGYISKFRPFEKDQRAGMFVENLNSNVKGKFIYLTDNTSSVCDPTLIHQNTDPSMVDDMEVSGIGDLNLDWSFWGANSTWEIATDQYYRGSKSLRNSPFLNTGNSYARATITTDQYYIVTAAYRYTPSITLSVSGKELSTFGSDAWATVSYLLEPGFNYLQWESSALADNYYVWIDEVSFKPFNMDCYSGAMSSSGVQGFTNISDVTVISSFVDLSDSSGYPEKIRFKMTRDSSDVIRTYYSESDISIDDDDSACVWIEHNNGTPFVLSGEVVVGCFACSDDSKGINVAEFSDFRVNLVGGRTLDQTVDRRYRSIMLPYQDFDNSVYDTNSSNEGTVANIDSQYHVARRNRILSLDGTSFELLTERFTKEPVYSVKIGSNNGLSLLSGYDVDDRHDEKDSTILVVYAYDTVSKKWYSVVGLDSNVILHNTGFVDVIPYKNGLGMWFNWSFYGDLVRNNAWQRSFTFEWEEDSAGDKWVMCDHDKVSPTPKLLSSSWSELHPLTKLEVRNVPDPDTPIATVSSDDKYTCVINQDGFSKDNMQYMESLHHYIYFCDADRVNHLDTANSTTYTVPEKVANPGKYLWLDFGESALHTFYLLDNTFITPKYHSNVLTGLSVDSVDPEDSAGMQTFYADDDSIAGDLQNEYNYYKDQYVKIGSEYQKILEYDNVTRGFNTYTFSSTPSGLFDITSPIPATYVSGPVGANQFTYSSGIITFNAVDANCIKDMTYVYVMRSW